MKQMIVCMGMMLSGCASDAFIIGGNTLVNGPVAHATDVAYTYAVSTEQGVVHCKVMVRVDARLDLHDCDKVDKIVNATNILVRK